MQIPPIPPNTGQKSSPNPPLHNGSQGLGRETPPYNADYSENLNPEYSSLQAEGDNDTPGQNKRPFPRIMVAILVLCTLALLLRFTVFNIRNLHVKGLVDIPWQTVANAAGLDRSLFYFTVDEDSIRESVNRNRYLIFVDMEKIFPNTISLEIVERRPFAFFTHLGVGYVLAQDGIVLEETRDLKISEGLIKVNGLMVWGQQSLGLLPVSTDPSQAESMASLFQELDLWGFNQQIGSIDIAQSLSISMLTTDGYAINLGSPDHLHAKIGTVSTVVSELRRRQLIGGIIEATLPGEATYRPE